MCGQASQNLPSRPNMDGVVHAQKLPVGTIFTGYCTGEGLGITTGPFPGNGGCHYPCAVWGGGTSITNDAGETEDSDIDVVYRPLARRASFCINTFPDGFDNPKYMQELAELFERQLQDMRHATGVDWLSKAAEPVLEVSD